MANDSTSGTNETTEFNIDINICSNIGTISINATQAVIKTFYKKNSFSGTFSSCIIQVSVSKNYRLKAHGHIVKPCDESTTVRINDRNEFSKIVDTNYQWAREKALMVCVKRTSSIYNGILDETKSPLILVQGNELFILIEYTDVPSDVVIFFTGEKLDLPQNELYTVDLGNGKGYITVPGFEEHLDYAAGLQLSKTIDLVEGFVSVVSFSRFEVVQIHPLIPCTYPLNDFLELRVVENKGDTRRVWLKCGFQSIQPRMFNTSVSLFFDSKNIDTRLRRPLARGFLLYFSILSTTYNIVQRQNGLFDCSRHYNTFRKHLECNLKIECENGEDESEACPYTSFLCAPESMYFKGKCFSFVKLYNKLTWLEARQVCQAQGGDLAALKTEEEMDMLRYLVDKGPRTDFTFIGLRKNQTVYSMYRKVWFWLDGSPNFYNGNVFDGLYSLHEGICSYASILPPNALIGFPCSKTLLDWAMCEKLSNASSTAVHEATANTEFPLIGSPKPKLQGQPFVDCLTHYTHIFMHCDPKSKCNRSTFSVSCEFPRSLIDETNSSFFPTSVAMFDCDKYGETVHYTLVCDFRPDCADGSDETRCQHREDGQGFRCSYGQWIDDSKVCDMRDDCLDGSDEQLCDNYRTENSETSNRPQPPVIIHMDGRGSFTMEAMDPADPTCPQTHFRCPGQHVYCMPVYLRCNGVKDCLEGEDEVSCDDVTCPGYYRCRSSSVCLHGDHLCDGWSQCPERDDELLCNASCPSACHCQGLAFVCQQPFAASRYPDLRYLDATGSGMVPEDVADNFYLVYLNMTACGLRAWPEIILYNLQRLDLSNNEISAFSLQHLHLLRTLQLLRLKGNPLETILTTNLNMTHNALSDVDFSHTLISQLDVVSLTPFPAIRYLNMSFSKLRKIQVSNIGFIILSALSVVDFQGCELTEFPANIFEGLRELTFVYAQNYKICCKSSLPTDFNIESCFAPKDEISSCDDLLQSNFYRACLWTMSVMSVLGNSGCLVYKLIYQRAKILKSGYNLFVSSLNISDLIMGVYLAIVGAADERYRGEYLWNDKMWKTSVTCQTAGFLSLLSNEVSSFMICLITLDRFIVLRFPFSTVRFKSRSAVTASALAWTVGLLLAAVPLLPSLSHWSFYSQTGICIPLPITRRDFQGKMYSFGIMIVFNFILFVLIVIGQIVIYYSIRSNSIDSAASSSQQVKIARRLITVVISNFLCWFPIGVLGLAAFSGIPVPGEVNVAVAIFVLPLNSALNPFIYTYNLLMEKRRTEKDNKLLESLQSRILVKSKCDPQ